jgi:hypothetical protein
MGFIDTNLSKIEYAKKVRPVPFLGVYKSLGEGRIRMHMEG